MRIPLAMLLLCGSFPLSAQSFAPQVVAASGAFYSRAAGSFSFTVGELAAIQTFSRTDIPLILTQGFQQNDPMGSLPLRLRSFTGQRIGHSISVAWKLTGETEGNRYTLLRSVNSQTFLSITSLSANPKSVETSYYFLDTGAVAGINYYKLHVHETSGMQWDSWIIRLNATEHPQRIYPNPVRDRVVVELYHDREENRLLDLLDNQGRKVKQFIQPLKTGNNIFTLTIQDLPAGSYWLKGLGDTPILIVKQ